MPIQKTVQDTLEVAAVNGTVLSVTTFSNIELALKINFTCYFYSLHYRQMV
jgi:hypothetical protein